MDWKVNETDENIVSPNRIDWKFDFFNELSNGQIDDEVRATVKDNNSYPLSQTTVGQKVWLVGFQGKGGINRLLGMGLNPGAQLQIISAQPSGSVLVAIEDNRIGVGSGMANNILVSDQENRKNQTKTILLREMPEGTEGRVVGYNEVKRGYKKKLLSMGMTPGVTFKVIRVAPLGDPVEILVRDFHLSLRKEESDALVVEVV
ncbi:FeoA family protein [Dapis sp. BLCC M229]|uniref:FeoA family protein n=1 Tax=Dapis sp. BLCC M229 TaxID=3400188 RepID=UPI003CF045DA